MDLPHRLRVLKPLDLRKYRYTFLVYWDTFSVYIYCVNEAEAQKQTLNQSRAAQGHNIAPKEVAIARRRAIGTLVVFF